MAGFAGYFNLKASSTVLEQMGQAIQHRGPDYHQQFEGEDLSLIYLGLDSSYKYDGNELYENDRFVVLINGQIKNYKKLFDQVDSSEPAGELTPSQAIAAYLKTRGIKALAQLIHGHYIIIIYDKKNHSLYFIRDRFGAQPIFYQKNNGGLLFASEAKALLKHPLFKKKFNTQALRPYLISQSPSLRESFFKDVYKQAPATILKFSQSKIEIESYWELKFEKEDIALDEAIYQINQVVGKNIEEIKNNYSSQTIGSYLSGGVDSSYLAARFMPKHTYTVGYSDEKFSEINNAAALSNYLGIQHQAKTIDAEQSFAALADIQYMMDEPLANLSAIPMYFLSQLTAKTTNLALSGEGADEFFGGYLDYKDPSIISKYRQFVPYSLRRLLGRRAQASTRDFKGKNFLSKGLAVEDWFIGQASIFGEGQANLILNEPYQNSPHFSDIVKPYYDQVKGESDLVKKQYLDFHVWLNDDINLKADRMNMAHSVQTLMPIFDLDVLNFARKLPDRLKVQDEHGKIAFRQATLEYLPEEWSHRPKLGFPVPVRLWLQDEKYLQEIERTFHSDIAGQFFNCAGLQELIDRNRKGQAQHRKIWTVYMFLLWYDAFFVKR